MSVSRGQFITLEGSEGAGKSTNVDLVCDTLTEAGVVVYRSREPGGTPLAEALRELLLADWDERVDGFTEAMVVFASRNQHLKEVIEPHLASGTWVVCDRFTDATFAYQGAGRGVDTEWLKALERWVQGGLQPDLTLYLDVPPDISESRIADRSKDRMEREQRAFFERVRAGYLARAQAEARFRVIDAGVPLEQVQQAVRSAVTAFLAESGQ